MDDWEAAGFLWLAFMTVSITWAVRIVWLLVHQRRAERYYRHQLAAAAGVAARKARAEART